LFGIAIMGWNSFGYGTFKWSHSPKISFKKSHSSRFKIFPNARLNLGFGGGGHDAKYIIR
jgi:hypothetical protein